MNRHSRVRRAPVYGAIIAGGITLFGNAVAAVALPWLVLGITGSAAGPARPPRPAWCR